MASAGSFRFRVLVGMKRIPLHARNAATAQTILGPSCTGIEVVRPHDVADDNDLEFFCDGLVLASPLHPARADYFHTRAEPARCGRGAEDGASGPSLPHPGASGGISGLEYTTSVTGRGR